jgi:hypothetical protein
MDLRIINGPKAVEGKHLLVPLSNWNHFIVRLVTNAMIDKVQTDSGPYQS